MESSIELGFMRVTEKAAIAAARTMGHAPSIRSGGAEATLKGIQFNSFGAFFSRAYRENDYLWGRLHGAERVIDLIASTVEEPLPAAVIRTAKRDAFLAVLESEHDRLTAEPGLVQRLVDEVMAAFAANPSSSSRA